MGANVISGSLTTVAIPLEEVRSRRGLWVRGGIPAMAARRDRNRAQYRDDGQDTGRFEHV